MQSIDEFTPSTTEPVFGSGLVSQKIATSTNNDVSDNEKVIPPSDTTVNGENDTGIKATENIANGKTGNVDASDSSTVHVNGEHETAGNDISNDVKPIDESDRTAEKIEQEPQPEPVSSAPMETGNEPSSTTVDSASAPSVAESASTSEVAGESTSTPIESASEIPVATASEPLEPKGKSPRSRAAKPPVATATPIRQSTRARKPASTSNGDETTPVEPSVSTTPIETPTPSSSTPQRSKRQAVPTAQEPVVVHSQPTSTNEIDNSKSTPDEQIEGEVKGTPGKKRAAAKASSNSTKKARGQTSVPSSNDVDAEPVASTVETPTITPPKKARTSATKKTPEPPSEEYVRKLRPRK